MIPISIFVEGKDDRKFPMDFILHHFKVNFTEDNFIIVGGCAYELVAERSKAFKENKDKGITNLLIFDSDRNNFSQTQSNLLQWKSELQIDFILFLFPNNKDVGNFETALENISLPEHRIIFQCFEEYQTCLRSHPNSYTLPNQKAKIYAYLEALTNKSKSESIKEEKRDYANPNYWNLNSDYLNPLKNFLSEYFPKQ